MTEEGFVCSDFGCLEQAKDDFPHCKVKKFYSEESETCVICKGKFYKGFKVIFET